MGRITEDMKILEKLVDDLTCVCSGLDCDNLRFMIGVVRDAPDMGGVFCVHRENSEADSENEKNIIGVSIADVQRWTEEYSKIVTREMLCCAIAHEMYYLKQFQANGKELEGHILCYVNREIKSGLDMFEFMKWRNEETVIHTSKERGAEADAYAICILGVSFEYYKEMFNNIIQSTVIQIDERQKSYDTFDEVVQSTAKAALEISEGIMHLAENLANVCTEKDEGVLDLVEKQKESALNLKTQVKKWADMIMDQCDSVPAQMEI